MAIHCEEGTRDGRDRNVQRRQMNETLIRFFFHSFKNSWDFLVDFR